MDERQSLLPEVPATHLPFSSMNSFCFISWVEDAIDAPNLNGDETGLGAELYRHQVAGEIAWRGVTRFVERSCSIT